MTKLALERTLVVTLTKVASNSGKGSPNNLS